eukprot:1196012-Prorocentrum_minimum.AAC.1
MFKGGAEAPASLGPSRDYNIDLVPKFMMGNGKLVKGASSSARAPAPQFPQSPDPANCTTQICRLSRHL